MHGRMRDRGFPLHVQGVGPGVRNRLRLLRPRRRRQPPFPVPMGHLQVRWSRNRRAGAFEAPCAGDILSRKGGHRLRVLPRGAGSVQTQCRDLLLSEAMAHRQRRKRRRAHPRSGEARRESRGGVPPDLRGASRGSDRRQTRPPRASDRERGACPRCDHRDHELLADPDRHTRRWGAGQR